MKPTKPYLTLRQLPHTNFTPDQLMGADKYKI
jgi:hypothetical protein